MSREAVLRYYGVSSFIFSLPFMPNFVSLTFAPLGDGAPLFKALIVKLCTELSFTIIISVKVYLKFED